MTDNTVLHFVGFGGTHGTLTGPSFNMGRGVKRGREHSWLFHFSFGYVSGFPIPSIFYYLITRHTTRRMMHWAWKRERPMYEEVSGSPWPKCASECRQCNPKGTTHE